MRAAIYCRISRDADGAGLGVTRQQDDCHQLATTRGWTIHDTYTDNDISAYSGRHRPAYHAMLNDVRAGHVDVIVAWHPDRLHRSPRELEDFIDLLEETATTVATCTAGNIDLATPDGRLVARIVGSVARKESEDKSRRIRRKLLALAENGGPPGGGRAFGYSRERDINPTEAALIQEAAARILRGESLWAITRDWTARAIPTVRGAPWSTTAVRTILTAPRIVGLRTHRGEIIGPATWEPILSRETWEQVRAVLDHRAATHTRPARRYLLSGGLLRCEICDRPMVAAPRRPRHGGPLRPAYACLRRHGGCGGVSILAEPVEALVATEVITAVGSGRLTRPTPRRDPAAELATTIAEEEARLGQYARMLDAGEVTRAEWAVMREGAVGRLDAARAQLARVARASARPLDGIEPGELPAAWGGMTVDRRRAVLDAVLLAVTVGSAGRAGARVNLDRVQLRWRA